MDAFDVRNNGLTGVDVPRKNCRQQKRKTSVANAATPKLTYYAVYREKKMTGDPDTFRSHNNEIRSEWMEANPGKKEEYQEKRRLDPRMRFDMIVHNLKSKKTDDVNDLMCMEDRDAFIEKIQLPCHYCGAHDPTIFLCGLDRVDSGEKFTDLNTVPCCFQCNMMKITFHVDEFIGGVKAIARYRGVAIEGEIPMNPRLGKETPSQIRRKRMDARTRRPSCRVRSGSLCGQTRATCVGGRPPWESTG
eukprot:gene10912-17031_t